MAEVKIAKGQVIVGGERSFHPRTLGGNGEKLFWGEDYTTLENAEAVLVAHLPPGTLVEIVGEETELVTVMVDEVALDEADQQTKPTGKQVPSQQRVPVVLRSYRVGEEGAEG